ncbi:MAG TPA: sulfite exporter TauE/SafE family protein, partial [Rhizomicrobium sp.]|nr:sulfite exporter TauE/SafE family protein [Rhizomicrobium sp.]
VIPPVAIGFLVGALSAILGIGGGFMVVPAMIYLLRMPTNVVIGTSLLQIIVVTSATTILQSLNNHAVDAMLAVFLIAGGVIGAQFGVRMSARLRGEQLRLLLALVVIAVAVRLCFGLVVRPDEIFTISAGA